MPPQQSLTGVDGQYPPTQFPSTACKSFARASQSLTGTDRQYPTPSIPTTVRGSPNACKLYADAWHRSDCTQMTLTTPLQLPAWAVVPQSAVSQSQSRGQCLISIDGNYPPPSPLNTAYYTNPPPPNPSYWYDEYGQIQYY